MKNLICAIGFLISSTAYAGSDFNCSGKVTEVLAEHPACSTNEELVAYKTTATGNSWICTTSAVGTTIIIAAAMSKTNIGTVLDTDSGSTSCSNVVAYSPVEYIVVYP